MMTKKALIPVLALVAASIAVPAAAQTYGHGNRAPAYQQHDRNWQAISQRKFNLDRRIDQGERNRSLSRREASRLRSELNSLVRLERDYMRGGLSVRERRDLDQRYDRLSRQVRMERNDRDNRRH
jgi:Skp family chaperone for outer membrane proteins